MYKRQAQDSLLQVLQQQIRELRIQRSQDSLKVNVLSEELQSLLLLDTRRVETEKDSIYKAQRQEEIKRIYSKANGAPLVLENDTLYTVYASLGLYSPLERTEYTLKKLRKLVELPIFKQDSLKVKSQNDLLMITYQGEWIQAISEEDAILAHLSQEELAKSLQRDILRAFRENDWIKVGDYIGMVIHRDSLVTRLKTINNEEVTVPNSMILSCSTMNFSSIGRTTGLVVTTQVKVRYDARLDVDATLIAAAQATKGVTGLPLYIYHISLNELNATYEINAVTFEPQNMYIIKSDLIKNIYNAFRERNIELTSIEFIEIKSRQ